MTFANDCANCCFSRKTDAERKKNFAFRSAKIAQKFTNENPKFADFFGVIGTPKKLKFFFLNVKTPNRRVAQKRYNFATGAANHTLFYSPCNCLEKLGKFEIEELKMFRSPAYGSAPISNQDDVTKTERRF